MVSFKEALDGVGIPHPSQDIAEGRFSRWGKNSRYWAKAVGAGYVFGDYVNGISECVFPRCEANSKDWEKYRRQIKAVREKNKREEAAAEEALCIWNDSVPISGQSHPYLRSKGVDSFGLRVQGNNLIVPLYETDGRLSSIQYIYYDFGTSDCKKRFQPGCKTKGCFYLFGCDSERILLCEGYATAASIHMATGEQTVVCFSSGNMAAVAYALRMKYPAKEIIICADNDETGLKAAKATGLKYMYPKFEDVGIDRFRRLTGFTTSVQSDGRPTDFNDYGNIYGLEDLRKCLKKI
ncbi:MAG: toprim domain-containing protein [Holosporales bacterium]|jgi:putative DNA primase/helicase|nr:toprim domain-containing protein [Holosporales bacterium]